MAQPPPYDAQYPPVASAPAYPPPQQQYPPPQGQYPPPQGQYPPPQGQYPPPQQQQYPPPGPYAGAPPPQTMIIQHPPVQVINPVVFSRHPVQMTCPGCHQVVQSRVSYEIGTGTWVIAGVIGLATGCMCCFLACLIDACKDAIHACPSCHAILGRKDCM